MKIKFENSKKLYEPHEFSSIAEFIKGKTIYFIPPLETNIGSQLYIRGSYQFFCDNNITIANNWQNGELPEESSGIDCMVYGGGIIGTYPGKAKYNRGWIITQYLANHKLPVVALPMTHMGGQEPLPLIHTLFARDPISQTRLPSSIIAPDLSLYWNGNIPIRNPDSPLGTFLREDNYAKMNKIFKQGLGDPLSYCNNLEEYIDLATRFKHIVTDRLMFAICGLLVNRKVTLLPDSTHKNKSFYDQWLKKIGCCWISPSKLLQ